MGLSGRSPFGHPLSTNAGGAATRLANSALTLAVLAAFPSTDPVCVQGNDVTVDADNSRWIYDAGSALTGDNIFVVTPSDTPAAGRWVRMAGMLDLKLAIAFGNADASVLATLPAGMRFQLLRAYWEITTGWTGGSSSAIGVSSGTNANCNTKGDLLGGASGDVAATLVSGSAGNYVAGTVGAKLGGTAAQQNACVLVAADTVRFDRITSAFTAGAGFVHLVGMLEISPTT